MDQRKKWVGRDELGFCEVVAVSHPLFPSTCDTLGIDGKQPDRNFACNDPLSMGSRSTLRLPECLARMMCVSQFGGASAVSPSVIVKRGHPVQMALHQRQPRSLCLG